MADERANIDSSYRVELVRKAIHFCSLSIPVGYYFVSRTTALKVFIPLTVLFATVDIARYYDRRVQEWFYAAFGWLLRKHESDENAKRLNGATYVLVSATLCTLLFPKIITITSFAILIIADMAAALIGKRWGRRRFLGKTLEGSLGFFASALLVVAVSPKIDYRPAEYAIGFVGAAVGTVVEALSIEVDDNLSIPLTVGLSLWTMYHYLLPSISIYAFG